MKRSNPNQKPDYKSDIKLNSTDEWRTPPDLFAKIQAEFHLDIDRAASKENSFTPMYSGKFDELQNNWLLDSFINPPYSSPGAWFRKAHDSMIQNQVLSVMLVKVATSEKYWLETVCNAQVRFLAGRIKFCDNEGKAHYGATFGSALVIFDPKCYNTPTTEYWDYRLEVPVRLF